MKSIRFLIAGAVLLVVFSTLLIFFSRPGGSRAKAESLTVYCAAGIKPPIAELAERFEREYGIRIQLQYGGSGTLLSNMEIAQQGDLFIAADQSYVVLAQEKKLIREVLPLATLKPVIGVAAGNPKKITGLDSLLRPDLRVALCNPEVAAIGKVSQTLLTAANVWEGVKQSVEKNGVFKPTLPDIANDLQLGVVDVAILWDATVAQSEKIEAVMIPESVALTQEVSACVLCASQYPTDALRFARWLNSKEGNQSFTRLGYQAVSGDNWAWHPEITFFCGAVNRRAVDSVIKQFSEREGVTINTIYNGCGILTGQMRTIKQDKEGSGFPDVYMACDRYYLDNVSEWFQEDVDISDTKIVIAVPKGNPKNIKGLNDLTQPGMRVSTGQPEQCTIGALTQILLEKSGLLEPVMSNVVMQTASSAMLVPSVVTRSVDATLAYITDTRAEAEQIDIVEIDSPYATAVQPFSIAGSSEYKYLGRRLFQQLAASGDEFKKAGFHFRLDN